MVLFTFEDSGFNINICDEIYNEFVDHYETLLVTAKLFNWRFMIVGNKSINEPSVNLIFQQNHGNDIKSMFFLFKLNQDKNVKKVVLKTPMSDQIFNLGDEQNIIKTLITARLLLAGILEVK